MKYIILSILLLFSFDLYSSPFSEKLVLAAVERTTHLVRYDGAYVSIGYPNGDVPDDVGVCTDVIIRTYRTLDIDLQKRIHEDMKASFKDYPSNRIWGMNKPDSNIDHRRVPNLQKYFERQGSSLPISNQPKDYKPADLVTWMLPGNLPHIGIVIDKIDQVSNNPIIVHNIGAGPEASDMLFSYKITGHYRFIP